MHLFNILAFLTLNWHVSYVRGYEQPQAPLLNVEPQSDLVSTIINFDDLYTNFGTGLGASNSFTYDNLTFKSFLVASIPTTLTRPYQPWDVNEVFCLGSAPNVIVGSRSNSSNLWPTISTCSLSDDFRENNCNGTFNIVSFRIRPMGKLLGQADGVRLTFLILDFLRLSEVDTQDSRETLLHATIPNSLEAEPESDSGPGFDPPPKPGFPPFDNTKTAYQLLVGYLRPGPALPSKVHRKYFRPGFGTKVDTIQIYGYTYPMPGSGVESVDWPFCIDDLELEFNPDEADEGTRERADAMGDKKSQVGWREEIYL